MSGSILIDSSPSDWTRPLRQWLSLSGTGKSAETKVRIRRYIPYHKVVVLGARAEAAAPKCPLLPKSAIECNRQSCAFRDPHPARLRAEFD